MKGVGKLFIYFFLVLGACFMAFPLYWMVINSFKSYGEIFSIPPTWLPKSLQWQNYVKAWQMAPFGRYLFNSIFVALVCTIGEITFASLAAYAFALKRFIGRDTLFMVLLGTMMIPGQVLLIPSYIIVARLGWIDTYLALTIPWLTSVFGIFLFRQFFLTIPQELLDVARIDGCGDLRILYNIVLPLMRPAAITVGLLKFVVSWNALLWPLIMTKSDAVRTLPVGLTYFQTAAGTDYHLLSAAATFTVLPLVLVYLIGQRYLTESIARLGLKG